LCTITGTVAGCRQGQAFALKTDLTFEEELKSAGSFVIFGNEKIDWSSHVVLQSRRITNRGWTVADLQFPQTHEYHPPQEHQKARIEPSKMTDNCLLT
jgi:hypothetical protein